MSRLTRITLLAALLLLVPAAAAHAGAAQGSIVIIKHAPGEVDFARGQSDTYHFLINPGDIAVQIVGSGTSAGTPLNPGTNYSIQEILLPDGEFLSDAFCNLSNESGTGTFNEGTDTIHDITVVAGQTTTCHVFNRIKPFNIVKTNDADHDGTFSDVEVVPPGATFPYTVTYKLEIAKDTENSLRIEELTDDMVAAPLSSPAGDDCDNFIGEDIPDEGITCFYDATFTATGPSSVFNTASVSVCRESEGCFFQGTDTDTSLVIFSPKLAITKTASAQTVPAGSPLSFTMTVGNTGRAASAPVRLTDTLPTNAGFNWAVDPANPDCAIAAGVLTCNFGSLGNGATKTVTVTTPTTRASCGPVSNTASAVEVQEQVRRIQRLRLAGRAAAPITATATSAVQCSGVTLDKSGPTVAHHDDALNYTFAVGNGGGNGLTNVVVTDDKCTVGATPVKTNSDNDDQLETPGTNGTSSEIWTYSCTGAPPPHADGEANPVHNVAVVTATSAGGTITATDSHDTRLIHPAVAINLKGPASVKPGAKITYTMDVTNPGDTPLIGQTLAVTSQGCDDPPTLKSKNGDESPDLLNPGDTWTYTCTRKLTARSARQAGPITNTADVVGTDELGASVDSDDQVSTKVEAGAVLPEVDKGKATVRGPSRCVKGVFTMRFNGQSISRVTIKIDGKKVKTFKKPPKKFSYKIFPGQYKDGMHRLKAKVQFAKGSGTKPRTLRAAFQECVKPAIAPTFTG